MRFFDTHCHWDFPPLQAIANEVLGACSAVGVDRILIPGVVAGHWNRVLALAVGAESLLPALGLHPGFVAEHQWADLARLERMLADHPVVAVGEIGLDCWYGQADLELQQAYFQAQLAVADTARLPVILHVRKAHDLVLKQLRRQRLARGGVVHAFSGSPQQAEQYLALGFRLGVGGALTYPRARRLRQTMVDLPVEALVLETDAPDMPLNGFQGQANRPDRLPGVFRVLAELRQEEPVWLAERLYLNSCDLFGVSP